MKLIYPCYITIEAKDALDGKRKLQNMFQSEHILNISFAISKPIESKFYYDKTGSDPSKKRRN